jgi:hypothetical protein
MTRRLNAGRVLVLGALAGLVVWQLASWLGSQRAPDGLVNQIWIDHWPEGPRDMTAHVVALERDGRRMGSAGRASRWRVMSDGFVWRREGDRVRARFPQNDQHAAFQVRTWNCAGDAPRQFELCLELKGQRGGKPQTLRFYSRKAWVIRPNDDRRLPDEIAWITPAVKTALAMPDDGLGQPGADAPGGVSDDLGALLPPEAP